MIDIESAIYDVTALNKNAIDGMEELQGNPEDVNFDDSDG